MKSFNTTKTIVAFFSLSAIVLGSTYRDLQFMKPTFMNDSEIKLSKRLDDAERSIASFEKSPATLWFPLNNDNRGAVNGAWNVYRFVDVNDNVESMNSKINFELVGNGKVMLNRDENQVFNISFMTASTIALWKKVDGGFEILEAKRVNAKRNSFVRSAANAITEEVERKELVLAGALNAKLFNGILDGDSVEGSLVMEGDQVSDFKVTIFKGTEKEMTESFFLADIQSGVLTTAGHGDEDIHGLVHADKDGSFKITINSGKLAGTIFNFKSELNVVEISEDERRVREERQLEESNQNDVKEEVVVAQNNFAAAREEAAVATQEEMSEIVESEGFVMNPAATN